MRRCRCDATTALLVYPVAFIAALAWLMRLIIVGFSAGDPVLVLLMAVALLPPLFIVPLRAEGSSVPFARRLVRMPVLERLQLLHVVAVLLAAIAMQVKLATVLRTAWGL